MKLLFRIFLSLSWLLLGLNSGTQGHELDGCILYSPARNVLHESYVVPPFKVCNESILPKYTPPANEYKYERVYEERDEQNTTSPTIKKKKSSNYSNYFTAFYSTSSKYFHYFPDECPFSERHSTFISLSRTIAFGVFLI